MRDEEVWLVKVRSFTVYIRQVVAMCSQWSARMSFLDLVAPYITQDFALTLWSPGSSMHGESTETVTNVAILAN